MVKPDRSRQGCGGLLGQWCILLQKMEAKIDGRWLLKILGIGGHDEQKRRHNDNSARQDLRTTNHHQEISIHKFDRKMDLARLPCVPAKHTKYTKKSFSHFSCVAWAQVLM